MKRIYFLLVIALAFAAVATAQNKNPLAEGKELNRVELKNAPGQEAILVLRTLPPGAESGKHTNSGGEIVYVLSGSIVFEAEGKPAQTLKAGGSFTTTGGEVHNVKNASKTAPAKALAVYIAGKGAKLDELSVPAK